MASSSSSYESFGRVRQVRARAAGESPAAPLAAPLPAPIAADAVRHVVFKDQETERALRRADASAGMLKEQEPPGEVRDAPGSAGRAVDGTKEGEVKGQKVLKKRSSRQFWMDDAACKTCCNCEIAFSLLRRKHHCRACGRIFCANCTTKTVDGTDYGYTGQVRVCDECFSAVQKVIDGMGKDHRETKQRLREYRSSRSLAEPGLYSEGDGQEDTENDDNGKEQGGGAESKQASEGQGEEEDDGSAFDLDHPTTVVSGGHIEQGGARQRRVDPGRHRGVTIAPGSASGFANLQRAMSMSRDTQALDLTDVMNSERKLDEEQSVMDHSMTALGKRAVTSSFWTRQTRSSSFSGRGNKAKLWTEGLDGLETEKSRTNSLRFDRSPVKVAETVDALKREYENMDGLRKGDKAATLRVQKELFSRRMDRALDRLVHASIAGLRDKRPSILLSEKAQKDWALRLRRISRQFCNSVRPFNMDFDGYCKLVSIPGGAIEESKLLDGIICEHNVVHRLMRQKVKQPRIMLMSGAIEFLREKNRIGSLDVLREQEHHFMELVVRKIAAVGVDLLMVGDAVSRVAQDLLLEADISLVINVPRRLLERVAQMTGAFILPSPDSITETSDPRGTCDLWTLKTFETSLTPEQKAEQLEQTAPRNSRKSGKTFMFFEGCQANRGASIYLRGGSPRTLRHMEETLTQLITTTFTIKQQNALFHDIGVIVGEDLMTNPAAISLEDDLLRAEQLEVSRIKYEQGETMNTAERTVLRFGTIGSDLTLGDFLRNRCFPQSKVRPARQGAVSASIPLGSGATGMVTAAGVAGAAGVPKGGGASLVATSGGANSTAVSTGSSAGDHSSSGNRKSDRGNNTNNANSGGALPSTKHEKGSASGDGPNTSDGTARSEEGVDPLQHVFGTEDVGAARRADSVYCVDDGRVFVISGSLSKTDPVQAALRGLLENARREFVVNSLHRLLKSDEAFPWAFIRKHSILTWSECLKCNATTTYRVLSRDAESLSFARWLQLKFFYKAKNASSLFPESESFCTHSIFQDYVTYFELRGEVAGFEHERVQVYDVWVPRFPEKPIYNKFADQWHTRNIESKRDQVLRVIQELQKLFVVDKLTAYKSKFTLTGAVQDEVEKLIERIDESLVYQRECLSHKDTLLGVNRVRKELRELALEWNEALRGLRDLVTDKLHRKSPRRSPSNRRFASDGNEFSKDATVPDAKEDSLSSLSSSSKPKVSSPGRASSQDEITVRLRQRKALTHLGAESADGDLESMASKSISASGTSLPDDAGSDEVNVVGPLGLERTVSHPPLGRAEGGATSLDLAPLETIKPLISQAEEELVHESFAQLSQHLKMLGDVSLPNPFLFRGRPRLPAGFGNRVVSVIDDEPTSWIAFAINSKEHRQALFSLAELTGNLEPFQENKLSTVLRSPLPDPKAHTLSLEFSDTDEAQPMMNLSFSVKVYCPLHFYALRRTYFNWKRADGKLLDAETSFLESLSRFDVWRATGGKSSSVFLKGLDGRFVAKSITSEELDMFLAVSGDYFAHLGKAFDGKVPSALAKIVGVYTVYSKESPTVEVPMLNSGFQPQLYEHEPLIPLPEAPPPRPTSPEEQLVDGALEYLETGSPLKAGAKRDAPQGVATGEVAAPSSPPPPSPPRASGESGRGSPSEIVAPLPTKAGPATPPRLTSAIPHASLVPPQKVKTVKASPGGSIALTRPSMAAAFTSSAAGGSSGVAGVSQPSAAEGAPPSGEKAPPGTKPLERVSKAHFLIMENLFLPEESYEVKFDLKGNLRNRLVAKPKPGEVLMDRNFQNYTNGLPLPLSEEAKALLVQAVQNDTEMLLSNDIVDYSMLLGIPKAAPERVKFDDTNEATASAENERGGQGVIKLGLIDFLQEYNYKKMIESSVKRAGMLAGQLEPTVIDPGAYRSRFLRALDRYFVAVPPNPLKQRKKAPEGGDQDSLSEQQRLVRKHQSASAS
ncbi:1-phosphatidylinositol-3-phosphate 5-kinase FAB1A (Phosphatidylinositol 3-phosphate 5-kinase) (FYVE finger-containing phosphoinositide kinase) (PIKfyve) (Phosphatidylinositol 3-phosphate 5-kinase type III) (PIPkin-III) (Type III PIP kinase) (Protein FORMS APLOID AND BINUCLEATE CELLS 1A) [Durusdinium trenchii]|uniref:1-phosphatidylinositol-3-phosphate 5-kinase n=1 Tax=Durusdinium trenchii TaxID=1381693 RepID=A0ABP0RGW0_9DINO